MTLSLRVKLILSFMTVMLLTGTVSIIAGLRLISDRFVAEMQGKVRMDMNTAREVYSEAIREVENTVRYTADRDIVRDGISRQDRAFLDKRLGQVKVRESLDMFTVVDKTGKVLLRVGASPAAGEGRMENPLVKRALLDKTICSSTLIVPKEELLRYSRLLAGQAHIKFVPTPMAKKTSKTEETSGMAIAAAAPVFDPSGRLIGALYGAKLLNRSYEIVDKTKSLLYKDERYKGKELGTVTIFQDDHRIATNVLNKDGSRAIGTRIWEQVGDKVLLEGKAWIDRAFVVHDWYITAYEPIRDAAGGIVGILYVGVLEQKYADLRRQVLLVFTGIVLFGMLVAFAAAYVLSGVILEPIRVLAEASHRLARGDFSCRVDDGPADELGTLRRTFNYMAGALQERDKQVKKRAQDKIADSERLAILGSLSAGIAHEINNPLGGILIYGHLLLDDTARDDPRRANLEKIVHETTRCRDIVKGLLDFARQHELSVENADMNDLIGKTLALVEKQAVFHDIRIEKDFDRELPQVRVDGGKIQQVLMNIIMNAAEAMGPGGFLKISTRNRKPENKAEIAVSDTGCGISPENLKKVFDPFFTTKGVGKGVGLGLAICHGIVEKHGGAINIESEPGKGTRVTLLLPFS